jgi:hypothetical protein
MVIVLARVMSAVLAFSMLFPVAHGCDAQD